MDLLFARNPLLLLVLVLGAVAFAWWSYGRMVPVPPRPRRLLLVGLRGGALALILILLFEPLLRRTAEAEVPPVVAVLADRTLSLAGEDGESIGAAQLREALRTLDLPAETEVFVFADDVAPLTVPPDSIAFDGPRTDIAGALDAMPGRFEGRNLRGVVLLSDGRFNTGRNPLTVAERYPVPIHAVTVGDTTRPRDVRLARVLTNEVAYTGVELPMRVSVQADGFSGETATVTVAEGGRVLDRQTLSLPASGTEATVELVVTPENEGLRRYTVSVTEFEDEATLANNRQSVAVRVLSTRRAILLLAGAPGPDVAALRAELEADPDHEVVARVQRSAEAYYEGAFPTRFDETDLVVLAGWPGPVTPRAEVEAVAAAAEAGTPVLFVLTAQTNQALLAEALGEALPARPSPARPGFIEAQLNPTARAAAHPVLDVPGVPASMLDRLPPVGHSESRWVLSPDAQALATAEVRGIALDDPVLAVRVRAGQRSAALLGTGTWRWRSLPSDLDDLSAFYPGLVQNLVRWLVAREDRRPVRVRPDAPLFDVAERVRFSGQVYDEALAPVSDAELRLTITTPDGSALPFPMQPLGAGRYALDAGSLPEGDYSFEATATRGEIALGTDQGQFAVGALALELRDLTADPALMRELARRSGGEHLFPDAVPTLPARLADDLTARSVRSERTTELRRFAGFLLVIVLLLTAEWVLRKRFGMV